jgi:(4S)-4-hydroxy-5-phosphonooxypentane-2,3-dione isomerase
MPPVALVARFRVKDGSGDELIATLESLLDEVSTEPGTELYWLNRSRDDPDVFWTCELYADEDAFAAHAESPAMDALAPTLEKLIAESEVIIGDPVLRNGPRSSELP